MGNENAVGRISRYDVTDTMVRAIDGALANNAEDTINALAELTRYIGSLERALDQVGGWCLVVEG